MDEIIYVGIVTHGTCEDWNKEILYVGLNRKKAKEAVLNFFSPMMDIECQYIQYWRNGKLIKTYNVCGFNIKENGKKN